MLVRFIRNRIGYSFHAKLSQALTLAFLRARRPGVQDELARLQRWSTERAHTHRKALEELAGNAYKDGAHG